MENRIYYNKTAIRIISMILVAVLLVAIPFQEAVKAVAPVLTEAMIAALLTVAIAIGIDLTHELLVNFVTDAYYMMPEWMQNDLAYSVTQFGVNMAGQVIFTIKSEWWHGCETIFKSIFGEQYEYKPLYINEFNDTLLRLGTSYNPDIDPIRTEVLPNEPVTNMIGGTEYTMVWYPATGTIQFTRDNGNFKVTENYTIHSSYVYGSNYNRVQMGNPYIYMNISTGLPDVNGEQKMLYNPPPLIYLNDSFVTYASLSYTNIYKEGSLYDGGLLSYEASAVKANKSGTNYTIWTTLYFSNINQTKFKFNYSFVADNGYSIVPNIDYSYYYGGQNEAINEKDDGDDVWLRLPGMPDEVVNNPDSTTGITAPDVIIDNYPDTVTVESVGTTNIDAVNNFKAPSIILQKFPFCIPYDLYKMTTILEAEPVAPVFYIPFQIERYGIDYEFEIDFSMFDQLTEILRWFVLASWVFGLILVTRHVIKG